MLLIKTLLELHRKMGREGIQLTYTHNLSVL